MASPAALDAAKVITAGSQEARRAYKALGEHIARRHRGDPELVRRVLAMWSAVERMTAGFEKFLERAETTRDG